jgi:hypothetical protein
MPEWDSRVRGTLLLKTLFHFDASGFAGSLGHSRFPEAPRWAGLEQQNY